MSSRKMTQKLLVSTMLVVIICLGFANWAMTQGYPNRPVQLIVPWAAGGETDIIARLVGQHLAKYIGQPIVVLNKPGGTVAVANDFVLKAPADGYTILITGASHVIAPQILKMPYSVSDFVGIASMAESNCMIVVKKDAPWSNLTDFINDAKKRPGVIKYGIAGVGNVQTIWWEMIKSQTGINIVSVPYTGNAPIVTALLGGEVNAGFIDMPLAIPHLKGDTLKALGITFSNPEFPGVVTFKEQGIEGKFMIWRAILARKDTPANIISTLEGALKKTLQDRDYIESLEKIRNTPGTMTGEVFNKFMLEEEKKYAEIIAKMPKK